MEHWESLETTHKALVVIGGVVFTTIAGLVVKKICFKKKDVSADNPRNTVILRQVGRGGYAPSMSPFPLKLETYLRMAKIPYQSVHSFEMSAKGKTPWIQYNDETIADSTFCIEYLNKKFDIDLNKRLTLTEKGIARAFIKMFEEGTPYWSLVLYRWVYKCDRTFLFKVFGMPKLMFWSIQRQLKKALFAQGHGRHSQEEINRMLEGDWQALSDFLGQKKFMFGDNPCEVDCALFGMLCQPMYNMPGLAPSKLLDKFSNLKDYCTRIKDGFWPDWEEKITHGESSGLLFNVIREEVKRF